MPKTETKKKIYRKKKVEGAGLLGDSFSLLGPINPFNYLNPLKLFGGELEMQPKTKSKRNLNKVQGAGILADLRSKYHLKKLQGGALESKRNVEELPLVLNIPSVPVDRKIVPVPGPQRSGVVPQGQTPLEQQLTRQRETQSRPRKIQQAIQTGNRVSALTSEGTNLRQMMKDFGQTMPKGMRNIKQGGKMTVPHMKKIYNHLADKHGVEKAGDLFGDIGRAFSTGFKMPFQALGSIANAII